MTEIMDCPVNYLTPAWSMRRSPMPSALRPQAQQSAETRPEASAVDAPPEYTDRHANRVLVGHRGAPDAAGRPQEDSAEPKADSPVEPALHGVRGGWWL
jgi:hypothetical protein